MTNRERFAAEHGMPPDKVQSLVQLATKAGKANEHYSNGDPHPSYPDSSDKNFNAQRWGAIVDDCTELIRQLVAPYGFTDVVYTGLGPTLKRGEQFVEVPY
jgi:hypothetical protein